MGWVSTALASTGLVLMPFGSIHEHVQKENPWRGFQDQSPMLWVIRAQQVPVKECSGLIQKFLDQVQSEGKQWGNWKGWEPWDEDDLEAITDCDSFPCPVKLDSTEVSQMEKAPEKNRIQKFRDLVTQRVERYQRTQERKEYEFPGDPADPWKLFDQKGFRASVPRPDSPSLWLRRIDFNSNQIRPIHQVIDRRISKNATLSEVTVWTRDVYTDHYFDGWGEWTQFKCEANQALLVQAIFLEVDELKKGNIVAKIFRGKMKSAVEKTGHQRMDERADLIFKGLSLNKGG